MPFTKHENLTNIKVDVVGVYDGHKQVQTVCKSYSFPEVEGSNVTQMHETESHIDKERLYISRLPVVAYTRKC